MRHERGTELLLAGGLATLLGLEAARAFLATIYYRNLTTLGINSSVLWALLFLAPIVYAVPAVARDARRTLLWSALALAAARVAGSLAWGSGPYLALMGLAVAAWLVLLPALLRTASGQEGAAASAAAGVALGVALDLAILVAAGSDDPTVRPAGLLLAVPAAVGLVLLALRAAHGPDAPAAPAARGPAVLLAALGVGGWLFLELAIAGAPWHVARWNGAPVASTATSAVIGLALGAAAVAARRAPPTWLLVVANAFLVAFLLDHGFVHSPLVSALHLLAQLAMAVDLAALAAVLAVSDLRRAGVALAAGGFAALLLLFAFAFAYQFAFVPLGDVWEGRAHLFALAGVVLVVLGAAAGARRLVRAVASPLVVALAIVLPAAVAVPALVAPEPAAPAARTGGGLVVLSFNVHQAFNNGGVVDPEAFVDVLREEQPDVVVLQESDTPRFTSANVDVVSILQARAGYPHAFYGQPTREQSVGGAILSRHPILDASYLPLPSGSDNRFLLKARLVVNGSDVWVFGVHLALPTADRVAEVDRVLAEARGVSGHKLLVGDFNSCPASPCPREDEPPENVWQRVVAEYRDAWVASGHDANATSGHTYGAPEEPYQRIDYVFVSAGVTVVEANVVRTPAAFAASDHLPVRATLRV